VLGLLFLKYISDSFERRRKALEAETRDSASDLYTADDAERRDILEDRDEYISENVFWVPEGSRFGELLKAAALPDIGQRIDRALEEIEQDNPEQLRGVLPRIYARAPIAAAKLGALVSTIAKMGFGEDPERARDLLGRTYEYFIKSFARAEGHRGGEFYTPASVTRLLVEMLEPYEGRVLDPACGSGGLFTQSAQFVQAHGGRPRQISILGQENNQATWRICRMNLAIHGISGDVRLGDSLLDDKFAGMRADYVMANPPFNMKKWGAASVAKDARWEHGEPPDGNANYAWIQHFIHHLAPNGRAGFVIANGSLTSNTSGEGRRVPASRRQETESGEAPPRGLARADFSQSRHGRPLTEFSVRPPIPPDVFFELFEGKHGGMTWRYPISLKYLAERLTGPRCGAAPAGGRCRRARAEPCR
jgi:type I restriction enzyme M protein